ncbi:hypothetical protein [Roseivirga misakiensis]|uniref:Uncharacterized protein n=1 Tax=Roseivirga misakiensis TaxID=1563681 RepID=A0A1E5SYR4_9BACT|nr:hypothetical protein [Roseivirga misakiensis]OEK04256.1 hypothetical protein BFP71_12290 [Roseivirga misakiensis]
MNHELLSYCLLRIEQKLGWASSDLWQNQDFALLSQRIFEETNIQLSVTTLKRVWGKVSYASEPSISTLNALSKFIGYENWSELKNDQKPSKQATTIKASSSRKKQIVLIAILVVLTSGLLAISRTTFKSDFIDIDNIQFDVSPVAIGLPNSVVFNYSFGESNIDSAAIQQSWNDDLTFEIKPDGTEATGIYYYPGFFQAKLIANGSIVKEKALKVGTEGWMATIQGDGKQPRYLYYGEVLTDGKLNILPELVEELHQEKRASGRILTYHYFDELPEVSSQNFTYEIRFKNTYNKSNGVCKNVQLLVHGSESVFLTPLSIPGCSSNLSLITGGKTFSGKENDHSVFGIEGSDWQELKLQVSNGKAEYYLNSELVLTKENVADIGPIVGFKVRFEGAGEIDYLRLSNNKEIVYREDFE